MDQNQAHYPTIRETEIPAKFYSFDSGAPFVHCVECDLDLLHTFTPYFVEKAYRRYRGYEAKDVIYEFAMCMQCAENMRNELSPESRERMMEYLMTKMDTFQRSEALKEYDPVADSDRWLSECILTHEPIEKQEEYVIYGMFKGDKMLVADFPYAIGASAMDEITGLLSAKTLGEIDDFMGKHFTGPPEVNELIGPRRPVFF
ncbi:MAG: hypothetical protein IH947_15165 [Bacteroidetes bacterium]|nr:hypothetical protein [Bacteroidota bacterium]